MSQGKLWTQRDRYGNEIYLSHERWEHITEAANHPELVPYLSHIRETIRSGRRQQDALIPNAYKYYHEFHDLPKAMNHVVAVVIFKEVVDTLGKIRPEKFIVTAYFQFF